MELLYEKEISLEIQKGNIHLEDYKIGKLFFQPIIENAIIHGKLNLIEEPSIQIRIHVEEAAALYIDILNNGKELEEERAKTINEQFAQRSAAQSSIGLLNVNQRIKLLFGEKYGLYIGSEEELVKVSMILPAFAEN